MYRLFYKSIKVIVSVGTKSGEGFPRGRIRFCSCVWRLAGGPVWLGTQFCRNVISSSGICLLSSFVCGWLLASVLVLFSSVFCPLAAVFKFLSLLVCLRYSFCIVFRLYCLWFSASALCYWSFFLCCFLLSVCLCVLV